MSHNVLPVIEALFFNHGKLHQPVDFKWRLIYRFRRPFLLLPAAMQDAQAGLHLYSAQRQRAKIWRTLVPLLFKTPAAQIFKHIHFQADASSEIMQFLAQQAAMPATQISAVTIMFSGTDYKSRVILLLCDENQRPVRVVKAGLNSAWRKVTDREADLVEQLPPNMPGCIRMAGRLSTPTLSAFAMDYFSGSSPHDDAGMENLFHAWLNPEPPVPLESFNLWRELAPKVTAADLNTWHILTVALAGKTVRSTLYHGDFSPWNICATSPQNIRAFDWERGQLQGIPGWDWFHFIIQTSILVKRHSAVRAAAEVEQLIHSPRFKKYAAAAEISDIIHPLLLAYLLHYLWTFKPEEGGKTTRELFDLLFEHWQMQPSSVAATTSVPPPTTVAAPGWLATARSQLKSAAGMWSNLFWEPQLNSNVSPPLCSLLKTQWPVVLLASLLLAGVAGTQYYSNASLIFLPFYLGICSLVTWKMDRRWGILAATVAAVAGPLVVAIQNPEYRPLEVCLWNVVMRFVILQTCVLFVDRIHKQRDDLHHQLESAGSPVRFTETWAVILASGGLFAIAAGLEWLCNPQMNFLPLYMIPCMSIALVLNLRWSLTTTAVVAFGGALVESMTSPHYSAEIFWWNFAMRFAVYLFAVMLLNRIRRENILFIRRKTNPG